jgi:Polyketide cyclase / dehydrase and lipid transport
MTTRFEVERAIAAEPSAIFEVLRSPRGHVAIDASGMLMSADGDPATAVGDTFTIHMDRESLNDYPLGRYDVTVVITEFDEDRSIAWTIEGLIEPPIGHIYGYRLEPIEGGTKVVSYYDWTDIHPDWKERGVFPVLQEVTLRATLGILARTVAPGRPRPGA